MVIVDGTGPIGKGGEDLGRENPSATPVPPTIPLRYVSFFTGGGWIVYDQWEQLQVSGVYRYGGGALRQADQLNGQLWRLAVSTIQEHHCG